LNKRNDNFDTLPSFEGEIDPTQRAWIEVSGKAIEANVRHLRSKLKNNCEFMAVVKADGYGHDSKVVSENAIKGGAFSIRSSNIKGGNKTSFFWNKCPNSCSWESLCKKRFINMF
jgi:alanine racemase